MFGFNVAYLTNVSIATSANNTKPDKAPQNAASDQVLRHYLLTEVSFKLLIKMKKNTTPKP